MRPEKCYRIINSAIKSYLGGNSAKMYHKSTMDALVQYHTLVEKDLKRIYKENDIEYSEDNRSGYETYGYIEDGINYNMYYISDRWRCPFRIRWLIDGIKGKHF